MKSISLSVLYFETPLKECMRVCAIGLRSEIYLKQSSSSNHSKCDHWLGSRAVRVFQFCLTVKENFNNLTSVFHEKSYRVWSKYDMECAQMSITVFHYQDGQVCANVHNGDAFPYVCLFYWE